MLAKDGLQPSQTTKGKNDVFTHKKRTTQHIQKKYLLIKKKRIDEN
jgi:hypothetical protein